MNRSSSHNTASAAVAATTQASAGKGNVASATSGVPFVLYALKGRVYASNVKQKLVDLGHLSNDGEGGTYTYLLDGDKATGSGFADVHEAQSPVDDVDPERVVDAVAGQRNVRLRRTTIERLRRDLEH